MQEVNIVPFAHLDLFWAGTRGECLTRGTEIFRIALDLLVKYPDYRFMLESTNFVEFFLAACPEKKPLMQKFLDEGRLEIIPMRAIIYTQLPAGETLVRNYLAGRRFAKEQFGKAGTVATLSDIPGTTPQLPQIAARCGMEALFLSHGTPVHTELMRYRALDGSDLPAYAPMHYGTCRALLGKAATYEAMLEGENKFEEYFREAVGPQICQWGMDLCTIREHVIRNIQRWNRDGHRRLHFSTLGEFFAQHAAEASEIRSGEIPCLWPNVESSWPDLWPLDLPCEAAMARCEFLGVQAPHIFDRILHRKAWLWFLDSIDHNQNGIGGDASDAEKKRLKVTAMSTADTQSLLLASALGTRVPARPDAQPIVVFNPLSWKRTEPVRGRTVLYGPDEALNARMGQGNFHLIDECGKEVPFSTIIHLQGISDTVEVEFEATEVPAFGTRTYYLQVGKGQRFGSPFVIDDGTARDRIEPRQPAGDCTAENDFWKLRIDRVTGECSLFDKQARRKVLDRAAIAAVEETRGDYICRMERTGRIIPAVVRAIDVLQNDAVACRIRLQGTVYGMPFSQTISMYGKTPAIDLENTIGWTPGSYVRIEQFFPFDSEERGTIRYGVPFGSVKYPDTFYHDGLRFEQVVTPERGNHPDAEISRIRLAQKWVSIEDSHSGLTIGADHRWWEFEGNTLRSCMLRGTGYSSNGVYVMTDGSRRPVVRPPQGSYTFRYRLEGSGNLPPGRCGWELNAPLYAVGVGVADPGDGLQPCPLELPDTTGTSLVAYVKFPEQDGRAVLRVYEAFGRRQKLTLPKNPGMQWLETDCLEENRSPCHNGTVDIMPFQIRTFLLMKGNRH